LSIKHNIIKLRRGTAAEWAASEPQPGGEVLRLGEPGYEKDTGKLKIGDGVTPWNSLGYVAGGTILVEDIDHLINEVIQAGGGIQLDFDDSNDTLTISSENINNPSGNRLLTSDGTTSGIDAESALTFNGNQLAIQCSCPSGNAGLLLLGDNKSAAIVSRVYSEPTILETEDGILSTRDTSRLIFLGTRGTEVSPSGLDVGDTMFIIRGDAYNPHGTLNAIGNLENRTIRIRGFVSASGTDHLGSSLEFLTSSGGSGIYDQSMVFDHNGDLKINGTQVSLEGHTHTYTDVLDFDSGVESVVNTLLVAGSGISLDYDSGADTLTISSSGATISNYADNRILTSDGTSTGINGETNLTFDGFLLAVSGDLVAHTGTLGILQLDTSNGTVSLRGQIGWNDTEGTADLALTDTATINIGEHTVYRVRNETGGPLYKGQAVYASNVHSNGIITPSLYVADGSVREIRFIGLLLEDINNNNNGYAVNFGHIFNIDTRGNVATNYAVGDETWLDGDVLYVHPTVAGKLTKVEPKHSIAVAIVLDAASNGKIFVRPTSYGHLNDVHDVAVSGAANGQFLQYNSSTDYWVPSSSGNFSTLLVNGSGVSLDGHTHTASNITDFNSSVSGLLPANLVTGTGIANHIAYWNSSNEVVADSGQLYWDATNNRLGISTITPAAPLEVYGTSTGAATGTGGIVKILGSATNALIFGTLNSIPYSCYIQSGGSSLYDLALNPLGGRVGIATTNPTHTLHVVGSGYFNGFLDVDNLRVDGNTISSINTNGNIVVAPNGTGDVQVDADTLRVGDNNTAATITTNGTGNLTINTNSGTNAGQIILQQGSNNDIIIEPNGGGQLQGSSGGDARGQYATDWQRLRSSNIHVAAGTYSVIGGGNYNRSGGFASVVAGGSSNSANGTYSTVGGGNANSATQTNAIVCGGGSNLANAQSSTVCGGNNNNAYGTTSSILGGSYNSAISTDGVVCGGSNNTANEIGSIVLGGQHNYANGQYSTVGGYRSYSRLYGEQAYSAGMFHTAGDAQTRRFILRGRDSSGFTINLKLDGEMGSLFGYNALFIPPWTSWYFTIKVIGRHNSQLGSTSTTSSSSDTAVYRFEGAVENKDNDGFSCVILPDATSAKTVIHEDDSSWDCNISILYDGNNPYLNVECQAPYDVNVYWVASVEIVQVSVPIEGLTDTILACGFGDFTEFGDMQFQSGGYYNDREYYAYNGDQYYIHWNGTTWVISSSLGGTELYSSFNYTPVSNNWTVVNGSSPVGTTYDYNLTSACPPGSSSGSSGGSSSSGSSSGGSSYFGSFI
jgi:hypothetical protein